MLSVMSTLLACQKQASIQVSVPDWASHAVWYQIFPERFANGDVSNDPKSSDIRGSWPHDSSPYHPAVWTADWYKRQPGETSDNGFYYDVQRRRYGGDLQGVLNRLHYLQDLGVNAIYFNPLFESPSLHKYDGASYHHIDNNFGPTPLQDSALVTSEIPDDPSTWKWTGADSLFLKLVKECHKRGIRIIIDGVFNHVGMNFWAFQDVMKRQGDSKYVSWFTIHKWDDKRTPQDEFEYAGWYDVKELPEIREDNEGPPAGFREYVFSAVHRWMDPNGDGDPSDGIDGWRLDVAELVSKNFWRQFRKVVKGINSEAYIVGEVWWQDWSLNKMFDASAWLQGDIFDAVMNYRLAAEAVHFFVDKENKITASEFDSRLSSLRADYPDEVNRVLMNLYDSHDTDRIASQVVNRDDDYDHRDNPNENPTYELRKPIAGEIRIQELLVVFQMTYLGAPMVYYGDEAGMWGADDPDCRKPMLWPDSTYEDENSDPLQRERPGDQNVFDADLYSHYQKLINIRKSHSALQTGEFVTLLTDDGRDIYAYARYDSSDTLVVVLNNSNNQEVLESFNAGFLSGGNWVDQLTNQTHQISENRLNLNMKPKSALILARANQN